MPPQPAILIALLLVVAAPAPAQTQPTDLLISEFMASNSGTLNDEDGESSDWIEIHNPASTTANLAGWFLTDTVNNPTKWQFPSLTLLPNEFLVVFASGKNRTAVPGRLHTNFKLNASGEYLALVRPDGLTVASDFAPVYPPQTTDVSYGRDRAVPTVVGYSVQPTPGGPNSLVGIGFAPPVQFSEESRAFTNPFLLDLNVTSGASVRYTTTTNLPTEASPVYTGPIQIDSTTIVRARAFELGRLPGPPRTEHFIKLNENAAHFTSDLPITILHNYGGGSVPYAGDQYVAMMVFEPKADGRSSMTNLPDLATAGRFHLRGSSTQGYAKGSFAFEAWDEFFDDKDISLVGMPPESDWVLYAPNNFDLALIHNPLAYQLSRNIGRYAPRTRFTEVFLKDETGAPGPIDVPGFAGATDYNGIYVFMEKIKIDRNRVDIDRLEPENVNASDVTGGYLLKIDRADPGDTGFSAAGQTIRYEDPDEGAIETPQRDPQQQYIINYFNQFGAALNGPDYRDPGLGYRQFIDEPSWIDHHILNVVTLNTSALRLSGFFHKPRNGRITMGPIWDFDRTMGSTDGRDFNPATFRSRVPDLGTDFFNYPWWGRMFTDPDFWQAWIDRYQELRENELSTNHLFCVMEEMFEELREAEPRERARWNQLPRTGVMSRDGYSFDFGPREFDSELRFKRQWFNDRFNFIGSQFLPTPLLSLPEGQITSGQLLSISGPPGAAIYYTLDGTDPRAAGGAAGAVLPAPGAVLYTEPIALTATARVVARAFDPAHNNVTGANNPPITSHWSAPRTALYYVPTRLILTELMYHPEAPPGPGVFIGEDFEFIELRNTGAEAIDLTGASFTRGITFTFTSTLLAAGESIVIARNPAAFRSRYGDGPRITGPYTNSLSNSGERLTLVGFLGDPILDLTYQSAWYPVTDGPGFSLVLADQDAVPASYDSAAAWRPSLRPGGSPGAVELPPLLIPPVLVNEVLANAKPPFEDVIELFNPNAVTADVSYWYLTDDFGEPRKFRFPAALTIPPGEFFAFDEHTFNPAGDPPAPGSFALGANGDEIYLFSGNALGELTGYVHGFRFGPTEVNRSIGRYITSLGEEHFVAQQANTFFAPNSGPRTGPVVISEIMYHPGEREEFEYIELENITAETVMLFDTVHLTNDEFEVHTTNVWRLRGAVEFDFPTDATIPAERRLLLVDFDPRTNSAHLAAFHSRYGLSLNTPLFGPYRGNLNNGGDSVELYMPGLQLDTNQPPNILMDRVMYTDTSPWPSGADGLGPSLQRIDSAAYGNDPTNWVASAPTPGSAYPGGSFPVISSHPADLIAVAFNTVSFAVEATGEGPFGFQWLFNGEPLPGATAATLVIPNASPEQAGIYQVVVFNGANFVSSRNATLTLLIPATITKQPEDVSVFPGETATFRVAASSDTALSYQWRKEGVPLVGETLPALSIENAQWSDNGVYDVLITDAVGTRASEDARLTVLIEPVIVFPTTNVTITNAPGDSLTLSVEVTNTATLPIGYRWRRGGATVRVSITNSLIDSLTIPNVQLADVGIYSCVVTNEAFFAPGFLSGRTTLRLSTDLDGDRMPDDYEDANGLDKTVNDGGLDPDLDGYTNFQEFTAGTDPQDGASYLKIEGIERGGAIIKWIAQPGKSYAVHYRDQAAAGEWQLLEGVAATDAPAHLVQVTDPNAPGEGARYYRLVTPRE